MTQNELAECVAANNLGEYVPPCSAARLSGRVCTWKDEATSLRAELQLLRERLEEMQCRTDAPVWVG